VRATRRSSVPGRGETDAAILAKVASGELEALGALYDRYAPALLRFASRVSGAAEAEDIVQTTFLRVIRLSAAFDGNAASARPWLFGITVRVVQERSRSLRRLQSALLGLAQQRRRKPAALQLADARTDLVRGLERLSAAKRTVLLLAEVEGFKCEEIAAMLSIPVGTVWTRLHAGRRELRRIYEEGA
jgi:RNA polymerase sigma factor (sigma-70 family)